MITLHSIDLKTIDEPCFGKMTGNKCRVLSVKSEECGYRCPFYKPAGCKDWVRIKDRSGINLIPPEEYKAYHRRQHEQRASIHK